MLSLNERELVLLDGACVDQGRAEYASALDLFSTPDQTMRAINAGNLIEIRGRFAVVFRTKSSWTRSRGGAMNLDHAFLCSSAGCEAV